MENNELMLKRFGTTDSEKIKSIMECLHKEKRSQRIDTYISHNKYMERFKCIKYITDFARIIGRERALLRKNNYATDITPTERIIFELDKEILTNSFINLGYLKEEAEELVEYNYLIDDIWGIKSLNAEDYVVQECMLFQKPEKERLARYFDMQAGNEATR